MWLTISIILLSSLRASADFANPAPGIITWCNYSEPSYVPSDLTRITRGTRGAWACLGPYGNNPPQQNLDYTGCPVSSVGRGALRSDLRVSWHGGREIGTPGVLRNGTKQGTPPDTKPRRR
eukprot:gene12772-16027_t